MTTYDSPPLSSTAEAVCSLVAPTLFPPAPRNVLLMTTQSPLAYSLENATTPDLHRKPKTPARRTSAARRECDYCRRTVPCHCVEGGARSAGWLAGWLAWCRRARRAERKQETYGVHCDGAEDGCRDGLAVLGVFGRAHHRVAASLVVALQRQHAS